MDSDLQFFVKQIAVDGIGTDALIRLVENYFTTHEPTPRIALLSFHNARSHKGIVHQCLEIASAGRRRKGGTLHSQRMTDSNGIDS